jgi:hypothetical protein
MTGGLVIFRRIAVAALCGLLWAAAATAMETLSQPMQALQLPSLIALMGAIGWTWVVSGLLWALAALLFANLSGRQLAVLIAPLALAIALVHLATWSLGLTISMNEGVSALLGQPPPLDALFLHVFWMNMFYGGLYLFAFAGWRRAWRSQRLLAELASSRAEMDAVRQEQRLQTLRGGLQPAILVEALEAVQTHFTAAPARASAIFDELVRFLRTAMPAIREQRATLGSELKLVERYAELRRQIGVGGGAAWPEPPSLLGDVPFPPLRLLPLVEELACNLPADAALQAHWASGPSWTVVRLDVPCGPQPLAETIGGDAERRLRLELTALHGPKAVLMLSRNSGNTSLRIAVAEPSCIVPFNRQTFEDNLP